MLGKRKLHDLVVSKLETRFDVPKCKNCCYKRFGKYERLTFYTFDSSVSFTTLFGGQWNHLVVRNEEDFVICDVII